MPKASSSGRKRKLSKYQRAEASRRRDAGETLAPIAKGYGIAISMISRLSSRSTGAWSAAELDQSRHRTEMDRRGDRYRREPGKCNFPAWKPTCHDLPQTLRGGRTPPRIQARFTYHYGTIGLGGNNKTASGEA
jgi:hypothetical protein